jgi:ankyrin repeat protein
VRFAHYSVQEYLMSTRIVNRQYMVISTRAHQLAAALSLIYLFYCEKEDLETDLQDASFNNDRRNLYNYAVRYWFQHYRDSDPGEQRPIELVDLCARFLASSVIPLEASINASFLLTNGLPLSPWDFLAPRLWFAYRESGSVDQAIYCAAIFGFNDVINVFLQRGANIDSEFIVGFGNPLIVAIEYDNPSTVQFLLDRGADVDMADRLVGRMQSDEDGEKLLYEEQDQTLALFASKSDGYMGNLLARAIGSCRSEATVQCLLDHGADANSRPVGFDSLLQAVARNKESIVRLLLDNGAEINTEGNNAGNAFHAAICARSGGQSLVRLLLERGADIHAPGRWYGSALHAAAEIGDWEVAELLIEKGAEVDRADRVRWTGTALQAAAYEGYISVVEVLLKHGANPFSEGGRYGSPFEAAVFMENLEIVQLLCPHRFLMEYERKILTHALEQVKPFRDEEIMERIVGFLENKLAETAD